MIGSIGESTGVVVCYVGLLGEGLLSGTVGPAGDAGIPVDGASVLSYVSPHLAEEVEFMVV